MATKNRVIRVDDDLWDRISELARRRHRPLAEIARQALYEFAADGLTARRCSVCAAPASEKLTALLGPFSYDGPDTAEPDRDRATLELYVCALHRDTINDALEDRFGINSVGRSLPSSDPCPDDFHTRDTMRADDEYTPRGQSGSWVGSGYRCKTCGFQSFSVRPGTTAELMDESAAWLRNLIRELSPEELAAQESEWHDELGDRLRRFTEDSRRRAGQLP